MIRSFNLHHLPFPNGLIKLSSVFDWNNLILIAMHRQDAGPLLQHLHSCRHIHSGALLHLLPRHLVHQRYKISISIDPGSCYGDRGATLHGRHSLRSEQGVHATLHPPPAGQVNNPVDIVILLPIQQHDAGALRVPDDGAHFKAAITAQLLDEGRRG
ncbi:unnamed protein product [Chondrus crispus]|uniref:Uncharacterized protein n=1 Tax=Chondrus crispus TaxID=2769 RepID=R7Q2E8_CHOCR|nr:unnamed protein product [Chondrus crispus]CDF32767.1 unnamed protein product [Chondrus crispus]|eukprot:XP_005712568.1 unnamed protein product [Chondrus crispus]